MDALVPASYFPAPVTFTLPAELRGIAWIHQRTAYALLMQCAWAWACRTPTAGAWISIPMSTG